MPNVYAQAARAALTYARQYRNTDPALAASFRRDARDYLKRGKQIRSEEQRSKLRSELFSALSSTDAVPTAVAEDANARAKQLPNLMTPWHSHL